MSKNLSANYYQENKEKLKKAYEKYQNLSKEEKEENVTICLRTLQPLRRLKKQLVEHRKKYYIMRKNALLQL